MKIYLAGTSGQIKSKEVIKRSPYILESYYYWKPWQGELLHTTKDFLLDSGAFTFFSNGKTLDWEQYQKDYAEFINKHGIKYFFELDIDDLIGYKNVMKLRSRLEELTNKNPIPVWHLSRGKEEFENMCRKYPYVAIGGLVGDERHSKQQQLLEKNFPWFIKTAHDAGAKIHALGFTKVSTLVKYHFDSVDSTRWNCARFGRVEYFDGKTIRPVDKRKYGMRLKSGEDRQKINDFTFSEWIKFQKYAETHL